MMSVADKNASRTDFGTSLGLCAAALVVWCRFVPKFAIRANKWRLKKVLISKDFGGRSGEI